MASPLFASLRPELGKPELVERQWSLLVADTRTGRVVGRLPLADLQWSMPLAFGTAATLRPTIALDGPPGPDDRSVTRRLQSITAVGYRFMFIPVYGTTPITFGYVISPAPSDDGETCDVVCTDLAGLMSKRLVIATGQLDNPASTAADVSWTATTLPQIAVNLLQLATAEYGADLPLVLPTVTAVGTHERNYVGSDLGQVSTRLQQLTEDDDGPDICAEIALNADQTQASIPIRIGQPYLGQQGSEWHWEFPGSCTDIKPDPDSSLMAGRWYVPGNGIADQKPIGIAHDNSLIDVGHPLLCGVDNNHGSVSEQSTMDSYASADVAAFRFPLESWTLTVKANVPPLLGSYSRGDDFTIRVSRHPWIPAGQYRRRIVAISGDLSDEVTIVSAPAPTGWQ